MQPTISQNRTYQDLLKNKMDEANFENILTAELYTVNLNGSKIIYWHVCRRESWWKLPNDKYYSKPFSYIVLSIVSDKTVIYDKEGNEVKVNEVALNEITKRLYAPHR
jgi:hypothetical protein